VQVPHDVEINVALISKKKKKKKKRKSKERNEACFHDFGQSRKNCSIFPSLF
jgi:hypothetical protein